MMKKKYMVLILVIIMGYGVQSGEKAPFYKTVKGRQTLFVDGKPYYINGMTFGKKVEAGQIDEDMKTLKELGVNTIRTWGTGAKSKTLFDAAHRHGIKVMAGIWMRHGRPGAEGDDSFNWLSDQKGIQVQCDGAIETVKMYKDHPAILFWGIGNEVYLNCATKAEKVAYSKFLGKLCKEIKRIDPKHLISSSCAWSMGVPYWDKYCPDIDVYGVNSYGAGVGVLEGEFKRLKAKKPYVLTEFGPRGEWDAPKDKNGLKMEPTDLEKWDAIAKGWSEWINPSKICLGGFIFNFGDVDDFNFASVWLSLKLLDCYRPQYWATRQALTGKKPPHAFPMATFKIPKDTGKKGKWVDVKLAVKDRDSKRFEISFFYNQRLEGAPRHKRDGIYPLEYKGSLKKGFKVKVPEEKGLIKVYALVKDDTKNLGIAFTSFIVVGDNEDLSVGEAGKKVLFPFYVYKDGGAPENHYGATGLMGSDISKVKINHSSTTNPKSGTSCMEFDYTENGGWFGLCWQDPFNDWGDQYGGYDLRGAKKLTFWARCDTDGAKVKFGFGMITRDKKKWFDTAMGDTGDQFLTKKWKQYSVDLNLLDLTRIKTGFYIFAGGIGKPYKFYIDDIRFE